MLSVLFAYCACLTYVVWYGVLFIHHGIYEEGAFKFVMTIPENYPDGDCPVCNINFLPIFYISVLQDQ